MTDMRHFKAKCCKQICQTYLAKKGSLWFGVKGDMSTIFFSSTRIQGQQLDTALDSAW